MTAFLTFVLFVRNTALWLVWGSLLLRLFTPVSDLTALPAAVGLGAALAYALSSRRLLRFAGMLPAAAALLLCRGVGDYLLTIPAVLYLLGCICRGSLQPDRDTVYYRFKGELLLILFGTVLCAASHCLWAFRCGIVCIGCLVYTMRLLRHSRLQLRILWLELLPIGSICALCLALSTNAVLRAGAFALKKLYFWVVYPLLLLASYVLYGILWCFNWILLQLVGDFGGMEPMQMNQIESFVEGVLEEQAEEGAGNPLLLLLLRIAGVLLFLGAAALVFHYLRKGSGKWIPGSPETRGTAAALMDARSDTPPGILDRSPAAKIRRTYGAYCRELQQRGISLHPDDTTRSIEDRAGISPEADQLRGLYLRARYSGETDTLTQADARRAAALLKQLKHT